MTRHLLGRAAQTLFVLWAAFTVSFLVLFALPSDPVAVMVGPNMGLSEAEIDAIRVDLGLDGSLVDQYVAALDRLLHGDLGRSVQRRRPVAELLAESLPPTAALAVAGLVLGVLLGVALALAATLTRRRALREALLSLPPVGVALPAFWVGLLLIQQFSFRWPLFPAAGGTGPRGLVLPAFTLALPIAALVAQLLARGLAETMATGYADTARAKGLGRRAVVLRHALRNAVLPTLTMTGVLVGGLLSGSVVVETVFSRQGLGRLAATSVTEQDLAVVQALVLLGSAVFALLNLLVDLITPLLDPRITPAHAPAPPPDAAPALKPDL
ncbi:ABC transporter permease [Actinocorallia sp. A-T 12471]|uniref:ABC transporter permease n=1 Tax=Actinocorallia sp. A-T 12471 TaxID=3089813 RepID=UPI0029CB8391|nr:ABC transporter permease [Actinocorallia sp. A-T 12471]MDX6740674.1 ABC transporter permease [Actinocorallia sp. A-T 12471]